MHAIVSHRLERAEQPRSHCGVSRSVASSSHVHPHNQSSASPPYYSPLTSMRRNTLQSSRERNRTQSSSVTHKPRVSVPRHRPRASCGALRRLRCLTPAACCTTSLPRLVHHRNSPFLQRSLRSMQRSGDAVSQPAEDVKPRQAAAVGPEVDGLGGSVSSTAIDRSSILGPDHPSPRSSSLRLSYGCSASPYPHAHASEDKRD